MFKVKYSKMQNKSQNPQQIFISEEEKTINWEIVQKILIKYLEEKFTIAGLRTSL